ncbi:MAG: four-carbon acid sugar kinase family protein [Planctomycetota bacterium]
MSAPNIVGSLPPVRGGDLIAQIRDLMEQDGRCTVVLDDDPTGTQTVHGVVVRTTWSVDDLAEEISDSSSLFYVLTNSRSLNPVAAEERIAEIADNLAEASTRTGRKVSVISRSDSTLRGHYPLETDVLRRCLSKSEAMVVLCPFFAEGGRLTVGDTHYVVEGDSWVPAGETPFANDASFGFTKSNLFDWVAEKHGEGFDSSLVHSVDVESLRGGDLDALAERLLGLTPGSIVIVNALAIQDVQAFVIATRKAQQMGAEFVFRTAASFVQAYGGIEPQPLLEGSDVRDITAAAGLVVVGSYVPKTTAQLNKLLENGDVTAVELSVTKLLQSGQDIESVAMPLAAQINEHLRARRHVVLHTTRDLIRGHDGDASLDIGTQVSLAMQRIVSEIDAPLRYLIAKGGITSSDTATGALEVQRAEVMGQIAAGIPVWKLGPESTRPGLAYVVFPGNVGDDEALLNVWRKLR